MSKTKNISEFGYSFQIKFIVCLITDKLFLEQIVDRDLYKVMKSIDEMVKSDDPKKVFEKYKPLYLKLSNSKQDDVQTESKFW